MTQTQLAVSWDAYQNNICKGLTFMQERGEFVDMTLAADGHFVKVHKMVLSLISPYVKELITSADCSHPVIFLNNISYPTLCSILEYIYTGEVMIQREGLKELIQAGKALHIKGLTDMAYNEKILDHSEGMFVDSLNTEELEKGEMELKYDSDSSKKEDSNSDTEVSEEVSKSNEETMHEYNTPEKSRDEVRVETVKKKRHPMIGGSALQYTVSNQGGLQLILNRYIYNMRYVSKHSTRRRWNCMNYPSKMKCPAYVTTMNDRVIERGRSHNHPFHDKRIMKKMRAGITFCALKDAELQMGSRQKLTPIKMTSSNP